MSAHSEAVKVARDYYNSDDADQFYASIWGGEHIHIGLYESDDDSIDDASRRTVMRMASLLEGIGADSRVLDMGSGYGGAARFLASTYGCHVVALNLSEVENERARALNREQGLDGLIEVVDGSFESIPFEDASFDAVWSQDAILHSGHRDQVIAEAARVLKPGGQLVFTDPMQADDCPAGVLQPILDRIHLSSLASPQFYRDAATKHGLSSGSFDDRTKQLTTHYSRVLADTERRAADLGDKVSPDYIARMKTGLRHWIDGGEKGYLAWGIFRFRKA